MAPIILSDAVGPDTLIRVFNQEFHVHSTVLKIQCEFFKLFMDSPDKVAGTSTNPRFNYEWATKVDADGDWSLVSAVTLKAEEDEAKAKGIALLEYEGVISIQIKALYMILLSIYNQSFVIERWTHLARALELADYYQALPALSNMLYASIPRSHWFINQISGMAEKIVVLADKMQNAQLFRECMVHLMGPWHNPGYQWIENEQTRELATGYYAKPDDTVYDLLVAIDKSTNPADCKIMKEYQKRPRYYDSQYKAAGDVTADGRWSGWPALCIKIAQGDLKASAAVKTCARRLGIGELTLGGDACVIGGEDWYREHFLSLKLPDDELPWKLTDEKHSELRAAVVLMSTSLRWSSYEGEGL